MKSLSLFHLNRFLLPCQCNITKYIRKRRSNNILRKSVKWIITWFYKPYLLSISGAVWILLLCSKGITKQWVSVCKLRKSAVGLQMRSLIWKKTWHFFNFYFYIFLHQMTFATFFSLIVYLIPFVYINIKIHVPCNQTSLKCVFYILTHSAVLTSVRFYFIIHRSFKSRSKIKAYINCLHVLPYVKKTKVS